MQRLLTHFETAQGCRPDTRFLGIEVETLLVTPSGRFNVPISEGQSQRIMACLSSLPYWKVGEIKGGKIVLVKNGEYIVFYELGWNNYELVVPPKPISASRHLFEETRERLGCLYQYAEANAAHAFVGPYDFFAEHDTLMLPDKRDEVWKELDGPVLRILGHIASVHYTVDVTCVEEAFEFIRCLEQLRRERVTWPARESEQIWRRYVAESYAGYEQNRYGTAPTTFGSYCEALASMKVVMNRPNGELVRFNPALPFTQTQSVDMDLFLRSVWWWERLRVRNGRLMLEIRDIPRGPDEDIEHNWRLIADCLGLS